MSASFKLTDERKRRLVAMSGPAINILIHLAQTPTKKTMLSMTGGSYRLDTAAQVIIRALEERLDVLETLYS